MSEVKITEKGFTEFLDDLEEYARAANDENLQKALMAGGEALGGDGAGGGQGFRCQPGSSGLCS